MNALQALIDDFVSRHRRRLAGLDSLVTPQPRSVREADVPLVPDGDPEAVGLLRTENRTADDPQSPWHALTEYRLAILHAISADEQERAEAAAEEVLALAEQQLVRLGTRGSDEESFLLTTAAKDEVLADLLHRHYLAPSSITALRRVSAAESLNPSYPINMPAGVQLLGMEEVDREELLAAAVHAATHEVLQLHARKREGSREALTTTLRAHIEDGAELSSVLVRNGKIIGLSIIGQVGAEEAQRLDTTVAPLARCRLLWLDPSERGRGLAHTLLRHSHGRIALAAIPWSVCSYPADRPLSGYFWNREGYRPLTVQWERTPALRA